MPVLGCFFPSPSSPSLDAEARQAAGGALHYQECHGRRAPHLHDDERHGERHGSCRRRGRVLALSLLAVLLVEPTTPGAAIDPRAVRARCRARTRANTAIMAASGWLILFGLMGLLMGPPSHAAAGTARRARASSCVPPLRVALITSATHMPRGGAPGLWAAPVQIPQTAAFMCSLVLICRSSAKFSASAPSFTQVYPCSS